MKPNAFLRRFLAITGSAALTISYSQAATLTWDNTAGGAINDGAGAWLGAGLWNNSGTPSATWTSGDDAIFGNGGAGGAVTLASGTTVNSLTFNSFTGTYTLGTAGQTITLNNGITMNSGAGAATIISPITLGAAQSWTNNDDSLLTIGTGAVTNAGYLLTIGGTGNTTVSSAIGGAGGLTKSGSGILTLSGSNGFSGQLTVANGTLSIGSINNVSAAGTLGNSALSVILGSSGNTGTLSYTGATASSTKGFTFASGGTGEINVSSGAANLTISSLIDGSGTLLKTGSGTLTLSGATSNNYSIGTANQFTGTTKITAGKIALPQVGGGASVNTWSTQLWKSAYDTTGTSAAGVGIDLNTASTTLVLGGLAGSVDISSAIEANWGTVPQLVLNNQSGVSVSYGGVISNGAAGMQLTKIGTGTQTLTNINTYSGATTVGAGTLALAGANGTAQNSAFTVRGGTLLLDNSTAWADRLNNATALSLGTLTLTSSNGAGVQSETVGATTFAVGGKVTINNGSTLGDRTTLAMGTVTRSAGAAIDFVGTNGTLGGAGDTPNVTSSSLPANTNGILDWATVGGTQWAENNTNSIRAYSGSFFAINSSTNAQNAQVSGSDTLSAARVANSLNLIATGAGQSLSLGANNLTLGSAAGSPGAILKSGTDTYTISGTGQVRAGSAGAGTELIAHVDGGALTISAPLNTAILGIAKGGTGDLILSGTRAGTMSGAIGIAGGSLEFQGLSTTLSGAISGAGGLTVNLNAGQTLTVNNNANSYTGKTLVKGGTVFYNFNAVGLPGGISTWFGYTNTSLAGSNLELNGGVVGTGYGFGRTLGAGPDQVQITGGASGFNVSGTPAFTLDNGRELVWGSTYFQPSVFVLADATATANNNALANGIDLNGTTRTINANNASFNATISGAIRTSSGTAGLTKTGVGELILTGSNSFNGAVTVDGGTLSVSALANGGSNSGLGASSNAASNLLLGNGTTLKYTGGATSTNRGFTINGTSAGHGVSLDASGSGAVNFTNTASPAYGTVDQTRTLTLTGTYAAGNNTLAANIADNGTGAVSVTKTGAGLWVLSGTSNYTGPTTISAGTLSVGATANLGNAASNLVFNGGTLQITGTGLTSFSGLGRTNPVVFNSGVNVGLDINNAGNTFTADQVINQGIGHLTKLGAGTLALNQANTYTGSTTVSAGTLRLDDGGTLSAAPLNLTGGTFAINRSGSTTLGTNIPAYIAGAGSLGNVGAGTLVINAPTYHTGNTSATVGNITLSHALAIQNSALNTTGAGFVTLSGVTAPIFGGLTNSGTARDLATVISSGYGSVTNLTLNPQSGITSTYGGVIDDGATGMTLTKTGAGTQTFTGANLYTGATTINQGTLNLGGATSTGSLASTVLNLGGGTLSYTRTGTNTQTFTTTNVNAGASTVTTSLATQTIALGSLTRPVVGGTVNFGVTGSITTSTTLSNGIIGGWATTNSDNWATKTGSNITALGTYTATTNVAANYLNNNMDVGVASNLTGAGTINTNSLRFSGGSVKTLTLDAGDNIIQSGGILVRSDVANNLQTITGGNLAGSSGGDLIVHQHNTSNSLTIASLIKNNTTATALTKSGAGNLNLTNNSNSYSGGTFLNAGTLTYTNDGQLGLAGTRNITFNGAATLTGYNGSSLNQLSVGSSAEGTINAANITFATTTGSGTLIFSTGSAATLNLGDASGFTGTIRNFDVYAGATVAFSKLSDMGNLQLAGYSSDSNQRATFQLTGNAAAVTLNSSQIQLLNNTTQNANRYFKLQNDNTSAANKWVINTDLVNAVASRSVEFELGGTNTGDNAFNGVIGNGLNNLKLNKLDAGRWILSGSNTYTGATTVVAGTLQVSTLADGGAASNIGASSSAAANLILNGGTLLYTGATVSTNRLFSLQASSTLNSSGTGAINFTNTGSMGFNGGTAAKTLTLTGTNTGDNTIAAVIGDLTAATSLTKTGIGTWVLSGANTFTGASNFSGGGTMILDYSSQDNSKLANGAALTLDAGTLILRGGTHTEVVASTTISANQGVRVERASGSAVLQMGTITRGNSSTLSFSADNIATTNNTNTNGILGTWATVGSHWAVNSTNGANGLIVALSSYTALPTTGGTGTVNYQLTGSQTQAADVTTNTVRIVNSANSDTLALGTRALNLGSGTGGLIYAGGFDDNFTISGTSGVIKSQTPNNQIVLNVYTGTLTVNALLNSGSAVTSKFGDGTLVVGGNNTSSGAFLHQEGVVRLTHNNALGTTAGGVTVQNGAALELANSVAIGAEAATITGTGVSNGGALRNVASNTSSYAGAITIGTGGARINSDISGALTLTGGVVTSQFNNVTFGGAGNTTVSTTAISGAGGLTKDGTGTTTLTATNTYTGATTISQGTLAVNGTGAINSSAVTISGGNFRYNSSVAYTGVLAFSSGTISGTNLTGSLGGQTIGTGQTVAPGNSPGTAATTSQTWAGGGSYAWEINDVDAGAGTDPGWDLINGSGTLTITATGGSQFNLLLSSLAISNLAGNVHDFNAAANYNWLIADFASITGFSTGVFNIDTTGFSNTFTGNFGVALGDSPGIGGDNTQIYLTYTVPEPGAALIGSLGLLALLRRRRN